MAIRIMSDQALDALNNCARTTVECCICADQKPISRVIGQQSVDLVQLFVAGWRACRDEEGSAMCPDCVTEAKQYEREFEEEE